MIHEEEKEFRHPSYGMIGLSRCSGKARLFGSSVDHQHYISLRIHKAKMVRSLNNDHYYAGAEIFEVCMSPLQLSELLTGMNMGHGVPCTLARMPIGGRYEMVEPPPADVPTTSETYVNEFRQRVSNLVKDAENLAKQADEVAEKTSASKTERRDLSAKLCHVIQEIKHNLPFVLDQYVEQVERVTTQAKAEIESFQQLARLSGKPTQKSLERQAHDPKPSCPKCAGTGELPSGDNCGCEA